MQQTNSTNIFIGTSKFWGFINGFWKSCCIMRIKVFGWLVLRDRINTRDMLQRRHWKVTEDTHCELCASRCYEDRIHLFFECIFSQRIWTYLQIDWPVSDDMQTMVAAAKRSFNKPFFHGGSSDCLLEYLAD
jgi:hypothetical protein